MDYTLLLIQLLNGLQLGVLLFLVASGLSLVFGILDFVNLAHGSLYMLGAFICASLTYYFGNFILAVVISLPIIGFIGYLFERFLARYLYERDHLDHVLATFGAILVLDTTAHIIFGAAGMSVPLPEFLQGQIALSKNILIPSFRLVIIIVGLFAAAFLFYIVHKTRLGMLIRAGASNRVMVSALGVDIQMLFAIVFAIGAVMAGLAGMMIAPITEASLGMGSSIIITAFVVIIIGGIGSMKGAFFAALLIGFMDTLGRAYMDDIFGAFFSATTAETLAPALASMLIYVLMAIILFFRPQGLFPPKLR